MPYKLCEKSNKPFADAKTFIELITNELKNKKKCENLYIDINNIFIYDKDNELIKVREKQENLK